MISRGTSGKEKSRCFYLLDMAWGNLAPHESATAARDNPGGTAPQRVAEGLRQARKLMEAEVDGL